jgi:hypothetical protein
MYTISKFVLFMQSRVSKYLEQKSKKNLDQTSGVEPRAVSSDGYSLPSKGGGLLYTISDLLPTKVSMRLESSAEQEIAKRQVLDMRR